MSAVDILRRTPLHLAALQGHNHIGSLLKISGASDKQLDMFGRNPTLSSTATVSQTQTSQPAHASMQAQTHALDSVDKLQLDTWLTALGAESALASFRHEDFRHMRDVVESGLTEADLVQLGIKKMRVRATKITISFSKLDQCAVPILCLSGTNFALIALLPQVRKSILNAIARLQSGGGSSDNSLKVASSESVKLDNDDGGWHDSNGSDDSLAASAATQCDIDHVGELSEGEFVRKFWSLNRPVRFELDSRWLKRLRVSWARKLFVAAHGHVSTRTCFCLLVLCLCALRKFHDLTCHACLVVVALCCCTACTLRTSARSARTVYDGPRRICPSNGRG